METNIPLRYDQVPGNYIHCFADCPAAQTCMHAIVGRMAPSTLPVVSCYLPQHLTRRGTDCPHYHDSKPVSCGRGLLRFLAGVPHGKISPIVANLMGIFGSTRQYYRARKGEITITPAHQEDINRLAKRYGLETPVAYDRMEDTYVWE